MISISIKFYLFVLIVVSLLSGCASRVATSDGMIFNRTENKPSKGISKTVYLRVVGAFDDSLPTITRPMIPYSEFSRAVESSLISNKIFAKIVDAKDANYQLTCAFYGLEHKGNADVTEKIEVAWILTDTKSNKTVWRESINTEQTLSISDEFVGLTRIRMASEGAAQKNIELAIRKLSQLDM